VIVGQLDGRDVHEQTLWKEVCKRRHEAGRHCVMFASEAAEYWRGPAWNSTRDQLRLREPRDVDMCAFGLKDVDTHRPIRRRTRVTSTVNL
jgi:hypothetical protein